MNACATGCGSAPEYASSRFCSTCDAAWLASPEAYRAKEAMTAEAADVARMDFCNRTRAERARDDEVPRAQ